MQEELLALWEQNRAAVLFVTHDLDEAILLADKVAVLTSRPARVKSVYKIDLPRPRNVAELRYDPAFITIARRLADELKEEVMKARMPPAPITKQVAV
jgi:NitT/TauT family transport system ATP-binding protein